MRDVICNRKRKIKTLTIKMDSYAKNHGLRRQMLQEFIFLQTKLTLGINSEKFDKKLLVRSLRYQVISKAWSL